MGNTIKPANGYQVQSRGPLDYVLPRNPVTKRRQIRIVPEFVEKAIGGLMYPMMINAQGGYYSKNSVPSLVEKVGKKISQRSDRPELDYQFSVIDSNTINAWCLPGGKIALNKGIILEMQREKSSFGVGHFSIEEKIAAVVGHEVTHAAARHTAQSMEFAAFFLVLLTTAKVFLQTFIGQVDRERGRVENREEFARREALAQTAKVVNGVLEYGDRVVTSLAKSCNSRCNEFEADRYGMVYLKRAGYSPKAAIWLQRFLEKHESKTSIPVIDSILSLFRSHPMADERIKENQKTLEMIRRGELV